MELLSDECSISTQLMRSWTSAPAASPPCCPHTALQGAPHSGPGAEHRLHSPDTLLWDTGTFPAHYHHVNPVSPQGTSQPSGAGFCPVFLLPFQKPELPQSRGMEPIVLTAPPRATEVWNICRSERLLCTASLSSQHHQCVVAGHITAHSTAPCHHCCSHLRAEQCHVCAAQRSADSRQLLRTTLGSNWKSPNSLNCSFNLYSSTPLHTVLNCCH